MRPDRQTWRVRGVPQAYTRETLEMALRAHEDLQRVSQDASSVAVGNGATVHTIALDVKGCFQVATVRFRRIPYQLAECKGHLTIDIGVTVTAAGNEDNDAMENKRKRSPETTNAVIVTIDNNFEGLTVLHSPAGPIKLDVLATSGLGSHPFGSFMHKDDGTMWLSDKLPQNLASARVTIYGYNSAMAGSNSFADLEALASSMRLALSQLLHSAQGLPLLLIAHSLGGLLVKEALITMSGSAGGGELMKRLVAILFFGVPNDGMDIESLIPMVQGQPNMSLLMSLNRIKSQILRLQKQSFSKILQASPNIEVYCFYETSLSPTARRDECGRYKMDGPVACLVTPESATSCLPGGPSSDAAYAIPRTHSELVKFSSHDFEYEKVSHIIDTVHQRHCTGSALTDASAHPMRFLISPDDQKSLVNSLRFDSAHTRQITIEAAQEGTCKWLTETREYRDWLDDALLKHHHGFFWIKGHPGTGKSTLMKHSLNTARSSLRDATFVSHFFNARGADLEHSTLGLYRSLLVQLFAALPDLLTVLRLVLYENRLSVADALDHMPATLHILKSLLEGCIKMLGRQPLICYIDALDECNTYEAKDMILFFRKLGAMAVDEKILFRTCFASRHYPYISIQRGLELVLDEHQGHIRDMATYIDTVLDIGQSERSRVIKQKIHNKSGGIFMWVVLVIHILNVEYDGDMESMEQRLDDIPRGLNHLFRDIISRDKRNQGRFLLCMQWILFSDEPLSPTELYCAIQSGKVQRNLDNILDGVDMSQINVFVLSASKGLAQIVPGSAEPAEYFVPNKLEGPTVQFIHESVKDFFLRASGFQQLWTGSLRQVEARSHLALAACCCRYLVSCASRLLDQDGGVNNGSFIYYAVRYVLKHINMAFDGDKKIDLLLENFPWEIYRVIRSILRVGDSVDWKNTTPEYLYAFDNLDGLILSTGKNSSYLKDEAHSHISPVLAAFLRGHTESFLAICQVHRRSINKELEHIKVPNIPRLERPLENFATYMIHKPSGRYLFNMIAEKGHDRHCLLALMSGIIAVDAKQHGGFSVLSIAAKFGKYETVKAILKYATQLDTPRSAASLPPRHSNRERAIHDYSLLEVPIDINAKDDCGKTALIHACVGGHASIVERLIATGALDLNTQDNLRQTAMHHCCETGYDLRVVELLTSAPGFDAEVRDFEGNTALLLTASRGLIAIMKRLLVKNRADPNVQDNLGRTPLHHCCFLPEGLAQSAMELLSKTRGIRHDVKDIMGDTPLILAAQNKKTTAVKLLWDTGLVDAEVENVKGFCALDYMARAGVFITETGKILEAEQTADDSDRADI